MARLRSVEAEIDVPPVVEVPKRAKTVDLDVRVTLRNTGEDDVVVHAVSPDDRHFWHVFDRNHREVLREPGRGRGGARLVVRDGVHSYRTETIAAGHEEHSTQRLPLDAGKLKDGETYTVRAEFFSHVAESRFAAVAVPAPPRKRKKKAGSKPGGKKPAKRPANKSKAGGKKSKGKGR